MQAFEMYYMQAFEKLTNMNVQNQAHNHMKLSRCNLQLSRCNLQTADKLNHKAPSNQTRGTKIISVMALQNAARDTVNFKSRALR